MPVTDHDCKFLCKTRSERVNNNKQILVGIATCIYCDYEVDCPIRDHAHG